jgi:DNA polymerase-3 subunit delta'
MSFESFIGNSTVVSRLRTKLRENRFPHAVIFAGPQGVGKHTLALMITKALNCQVNGPADFCDECPQCRKISSGVHPDVLTITVEEEATQIKIEQIRHLLSMLELQPLEGRNKVFIIEPANLLNPQSSNALLKGLEEPPQNSFFILIAVNLHELLLTIRSRSQIYNFAPLRLDDIRSRGINDELTVRWSQGSIGRAQSLDVQAMKEQREAVIGFIETAATVKDDTLREMLNNSADLSRSRQDLAEYIATMAIVLRDLLHLSAGAADIVNVDIRQRLETLALRATTEQWVRVADFLREMEIGLKGNLNKQLLTDSLALVTSNLPDERARN